jgi:PiT family inorganic phosphate transporter
MDIIAQYGTVLVVLAVIFGLYMTWGIGANDVANVMGTSVGSGAITVTTAIIIAGIFEFAGAAIAGGHVTSTIRKGIIDPSSIVDRPEILVFGMLAALLAAAVWLMIASTRGWPVSTTHSIVGAVVGFAVAGIGVDAVQWGKIGQIVASWVVSPLLGGTIAFILMISIRRLILNTDNPFRSAKRWGPVYVFLVGFIMSLVTMFKGLKHLNLDLSGPMSFFIATVFGLVIAAIGWAMINRVRIDETADKEYHFASVEKVFIPMMIFTACAMAFAHGSNDVANGVGPLAAVYGLVQSGGEVAQKSELPIWILLLGGFGIVVGLATFGYRVMRTIGTKITELTPTRGFSATMAAGVGLARGIGALDLRVIGGIVVSWIVTLPIGGILAALFFFTLKGIFT